jgi:hypothetical protein
MVFLRPEEKKAHFDTAQATGKTAVLYIRLVPFMHVQNVNLLYSK